MFAYISGSPFVLQDIYGLSPQLFSVMFAVNALGLMAASQVNGRLVGRVPLTRLLVAGLTATATGVVRSPAQRRECICTAGRAAVRHRSHGRATRRDLRYQDRPAHVRGDGDTWRFRARRFCAACPWPRVACQHSRHSKKLDQP